jgi:hypothetical protein
MQCTSCKKQKHELQLKPSKLWKKTEILICATCLSEKKEPRGFVILAHRSGVDVTEYIAKRRYCGDEITAAELMT